jgi:hypothetical protein
MEDLQIPRLRRTTLCCAARGTTSNSCGVAVIRRIFSKIGICFRLPSLKRWRRAWKVALIEKENLEWVDLLPDP